MPGIIATLCICFAQNSFGGAAFTDLVRLIPAEAGEASSYDASALKARIEQLRKKYEDAKAREQSLANRILGAATIAATGAGGMMLAQSLAEKKADAVAERDMAAYMATFRCEYGNHNQFSGGTKNIDLPGGNEITKLATEYKALALSLKQRKEALGLAPGIESEVVLDSADSGLYNNTNIGKTDGAFTSIYRALSDEGGADAAEWAAQKEKSDKNAKIGGAVGGVGAVGGIVGNIAINGADGKSGEIGAGETDLSDKVQKFNTIFKSARQ